jgi:hypothetical protein
MSSKATEALVVAVGVAYLACLAAAMNLVSYDIWGALVVVPPMTVITVLVLRRTFSGELDLLFTPLLVGFVAKVAGSMARYWIAFDSYGGATDAQRYHMEGALVASRVWRGNTSIVDALPQGTGTDFVQNFTASVYTLVGWSKLAGFIVFGWIAFWGTVMFVKAACIGVPGLARTRYAYLCALAPSLVYWPSSIGKEAMMMLGLGVASYGIAQLLTRHGFFIPLLVTAAGLGFAAAVRPHIAGVWLVGVVPGLLVAVVRSLKRSERGGRRSVDFVALVVTVAIAGAALVFVGKFALQYLQPTDDAASVSSGIDDILAETTRRSTTGGSNFTPPVIAGTKDWPIAALRTLTRPLLTEARSAFQLISAAEMTALIGLCLLSWRRMLAVPRSILRIPYVAFAITALFAGGLAYSSFGNLGILTRQKSLLFPFLLLLPCLPLRSPSPRLTTEDELDRELVSVA